MLCRYSELTIFMNNLQSYCVLVDAKISASDKDSPVLSKYTYFGIHTLTPLLSMPPKWRDSIRNQSHYTTAARAKSGGGCAPTPPQPPATPLPPCPVVHLNVSFFRAEQAALYTYTQCSSVRPSVGRTPNYTMANNLINSLINSTVYNKASSCTELSYTDLAGAWFLIGSKKISIHGFMKFLMILHSPTD